MAVSQLTYQQMLDLVAEFYKTDASNIVDELNKLGVPYGDMEQLYVYLEGTPYSAIYNADGSIRSASYSYVTTQEQAAEIAARQINSNAFTTEKVATNIPLESTVTDTGGVSFSSGLKAVGTGAKSALNFTFKEVVPAVAAASAGITVGKTIDKALYNLNPDFWNEKGMSSLNPDTWNSITSGDSSTGARLFNMVFGLNPDDGTSQAYMDENALAYLALYMQQQGFFEETTIMKDIPNAFPTPLKNITWHFGNPPGKNENGYNLLNDATSAFYGSVIAVSEPNPRGWVKVVGADSKQFKRPGASSYTNSVYTYDNKTAYYSPAEVHGGKTTIPTGILSYDDFSNYYGEIAWLILYNIDKVSIPGISTQPNATTPDLSGLNDIADVLKKLQETYPNLWDNAVSQDVAQPDGTTKTYTYVPVGFPSTTGSTDTQPTTGSQTQNNTKIDPKTDPQTLPEDLVKTLTRILTPTNTPNPPDTGGGDSPTVVPVAGSASALYAIYNPTLSEINDFGAWLWSDNFIDQIKKLFSDPMQAIIGLHKVYATPVTGSSQTIKVGYLDSGVSANIVTNQYTDIDCGSVTLNEYFYSVFDYDPYTTVQLYLPFIGIVNLDTADVMRSSIHVIYHVDVLTGACLAEVQVTRDSAGGTLYQYAGNAAVTLPISSGSYMGIVASLASIAGGVAGTLASGGAAAPMLIGAAGSALNARTRVEHSGGFSGNAGAMGGKIPYLIISRPQTELAENYSIYIGNPSNSTVSLGSCTGYVKVKECHLEGINATQSELTQIESLLKGGVLI